MVTPARKGRDFELYIYNKLLKPLLQENFALCKWSGTKDEPGDIRGKNVLIDCKNIAVFSENDVRNWYKKITKEAEQSNKVPIIVHKWKKGRVTVIIDIKFIPESNFVGMARFQWKDGSEIIRLLETTE